MSSHPRPLSPHLTIYRPQITSMLSILHRITGVALYAGTALLMGWLWSAAYAPELFAQMHQCLSSTIGKVALIGWTLAFYFHLANGIRHLFWDVGMGFSIPQATRSGWLVLIFTLLATLFSWGFIQATVGAAL
jgi:succinate dehydrogenase / fumarate reductase cytochrome b subunit